MLIVVAGLFCVTQIIRIPSHKFAADKHLVLRWDVTRKPHHTQIHSSQCYFTSSASSNLKAWRDNWSSDEFCLSSNLERVPILSTKHLHGLKINKNKGCCRNSKWNQLNNDNKPFVCNDFMYGAARTQIQCGGCQALLKEQQQWLMAVLLHTGHNRD